MTQTFTLTPIGTVRGGRSAPIDDDWGRESCVIQLDERFDAEALLGLDAFSHLEVVYLFDRVEESEIELVARHPRGRQDWPRVGIFAQRGKGRPNRLGVSRCEIVRVEGASIRVAGLDAIDGTPVLDVKPYMREFGASGEVRQPAWATELMEGYY
jgi:tRNA-Thr(GGU) m(6)t(6)A37 methyltransferase TsaA